MTTTTSEPTRLQRIEGGLLGLLIGDALGVPYEFHPADELPGLHQLEYEPPPDFVRSHDGVPPGTWSDDGAQALCLLASLLHCGGLDPQELGNRMANWYEHGYMAVDDRVFDVGLQTGRALRAIRGGVPALQAGPARESENGNGSLMRVLPLALWHVGSDAELIADAALQSRVTHGHRRSQLCCALYCLWARRILEGVSGPWSDARATLLSHCPDDHTEILQHVAPEAPPPTRGSGYVVDCLHSAHSACEHPEFERAVKTAVAMGNDTDTTAAVAGGIAGLRVGVQGIPKRFLAGLRGESLYRPLLDGLLARHS